MVRPKSKGNFANFSIQPLKPYHEIETVAVRMCATFQITSTSESGDRQL